MTEGANGSVVPFPIADATAEEEAGPIRNPAERLHLAEAVRMAEAIVFASAEPVSEKQLAQRLPDGIDVPPPWPSCSRSMRAAASTSCASATPGPSAPPATSPS